MDDTSASTAAASSVPLALSHVSYATRLLEKRRVMFEANEALDTQKTTFHAKEAAFARREAALKDKDAELQSSLIKFNKFLQDNDTKRARAEKKEKDEVRLRAAKEADIERLNRHLDDLRVRQASTADDLRRMSKYADYLESVLEAENEFPEVEDLLARHETLEAAQTNLMARSVAAGKLQEQLRSQLQTFVREKADEKLGCNNKIADLQREAESAAATTAEAHKHSERNLASVADARLQFGQVVMACENIFQRCRTHSNVRQKHKPLDLDMSHDDVVKEVIERLSYIESYTLDMADISKNARRAAEAPVGGGGGASSSGGMAVPAGGETGAEPAALAAGSGPASRYHKSSTNIKRASVTSAKSSSVRQSSLTMNASSSHMRTESHSSLHPQSRAGGRSFAASISEVRA